MLSLPLILPLSLNLTLYLTLLSAGGGPRATGSRGRESGIGRTCPSRRRCPCR
jgi:hypothetical protein